MFEFRGEDSRHADPYKRTNPVMSTGNLRFYIPRRLTDKSGMSRQPNWLISEDADLESLPKEHAHWVRIGRAQYRRLAAEDPEISLQSLSLEATKGQKKWLLQEYLSGKPKFASPNDSAKAEILGALRMNPAMLTAMFYPGGGADAGSVGPAVRTLSASTASGRRLENIRRALAPDLPKALNLSARKWSELINSPAPLEQRVVWLIQQETGLPSGYILYGDPTGISAEQLSKLLAASLDDPYGPPSFRPEKIRRTQPRSQGRASNRRRPEAGRK